MARFQKLFIVAATTGYVVALRPGAAALSDKNWNQCTYVKARATPGVASAEVYVQFVAVAPGDAAPAAPTSAAVPIAGSFTDFTRLLSGTAAVPSGLAAEMEFGAKFGKGYNPEVTGSPVATHALIWCEVAGGVQFWGE